MMGLVWGLVIAAVPAAADQAPSVVVAGLSAQGFNAHEVAILISDVRTAVGRSKGFVLVTPEEMGAIDEELVRQMSGGCDEASCVAELAQAVEADFVINGRLAKLGKTFVLTLKRTEAKTMKTVATARCEAGALEGIQDDLRRAVRVLLGEGVGETDLRVVGVYPDGERATHVRLTWQGKPVGTSPFRGAVPSGEGALVAQRFGAKVSVDLDLVPNTKKAVVIKIGKNPTQRRFLYGMLGTLGLGLGGVIGILGVQGSVADSEPAYTLPMVGDALSAAGAVLWVLAWRVQ